MEIPSKEKINYEDYLIDGTLKSRHISQIYLNHIEPLLLTHEGLFTKNLTIYDELGHAHSYSYWKDNNYKYIRFRYLNIYFKKLTTKTYKPHLIVGNQIYNMLVEQPFYITDNLINLKNDIDAILEHVNRKNRGFTVLDSLLSKEGNYYSIKNNAQNFSLNYRSIIFDLDYVRENSINGKNAKRLENLGVNVKDLIYDLITENIILEEYKGGIQLPELSATTFLKQAKEQQMRIDALEDKIKILSDLLDERTKNNTDSNMNQMFNGLDDIV